MTCIIRMAVVLLAAPILLLAGCGGPSEADREACDGAADLSMNNVQGGILGQQDAAGGILGQLSGYAPDDHRLVRAVDRARDDARAVTTSGKQAMEVRAAVEALEGSL